MMVNDLGEVRSLIRRKFDLNGLAADGRFKDLVDWYCEAMTTLGSMGHEIECLRQENKRLAEVIQTISEAWKGGKSDVR